ncbi:MAG: hypothetical protein IGS38_01270 [Synechococcales cyanobacterium M58_A2018_015]|nr:hypothetical protein [Synechococcales cyanobacterium M58_A2018_015]
MELTPYAAGEIILLVSIDFECPIELLYEDVELNPIEEPNPSLLSLAP